MDEIKAQRIQARERARVWLPFKKSEAWNTFVEAYELLLAQWTQENRSFNIGSSMEDIAKARIALVYQMKGLESLFHLIETDIETLNELEQEEEESKNVRRK